jgi:hypothetical protein
MFSLKQRGPGFLARCKRDTAHACTALTFSSFGMFPPPSESKDLMISEYNFGQSMTQRDCLTFYTVRIQLQVFYGVMLVLFPRKPSGFIKCDLSMTLMQCDQYHFYFQQQWIFVRGMYPYFQLAFSICSCYVQSLSNDVSHEL